MSRKFISLWLGVMLYAGDLNASDGWSVLKSGMNGDDTAAALGEPMFKNIGRGFEVWLYDGGAEVLCYRGLVIAWTAPAGVESSGGRQLDLRPFMRITAPTEASAKAANDAERDLRLIGIRQMRLPKL